MQAKGFQINPREYLAGDSENKRLAGYEFEENDREWVNFLDLTDVPVFHNPIYSVNRGSMVYGSVKNSQELFQEGTIRAINALQEIFREKPSFRKVVTFLKGWRTVVAYSQKDIAEGYRVIRNADSTLMTQIVGGRSILTQDFYQRIEQHFIEFPKGFFLFEGTEYQFLELYGQTFIQIRYQDVPLSHLGGVYLGKFVNGEKEVDPHLIGRLPRPYIMYYEDRGLTEKDWSIMEELFASALDLDVPENIDDIARLHWWMCVKTPVQRGGGSLPEWLCAALLIYRGIRFGSWIDPQGKNAEPWAYAITSGIERFADIYGQLFSRLA